MDFKLIKDPIHGYIKLPKDYVKNVIDTAEFQRLRNIRQTSYDSLYPGSSHNRFIHSLGVYCLGSKAFKALKGNAEAVLTIDSDTWNVLESTFELACLLHDVGHMPFSHSGEDFLLIAEESDKFQIMKPVIGNASCKPPMKALYNDLLSTMREKIPKGEQFQEFLKDFAGTVSGSILSEEVESVAKPHEIMSVIVALEVFDSFLHSKQVDVDLFARAILGLQYKGKNDAYSAAGNALVQLLNSSVIDVDRLDYIMRDAQMSGIDSISIDIERLLESVTVIREFDRYQFAYKKNALSTIENVVLAYDTERRWIQAHPVIEYDTFLVKKSLDAINKEFRIAKDKKGIFQRKALSESGLLTSRGLRIRLLNDGDCMFLMKQLHDCRYVNEFLIRDSRKQPIWKSEAEFSMIMDELTEHQQKIFLNIFNTKNEKADTSSIGNLLNHTRIEELKKEISQRKKENEELKEEDRYFSCLTLEKQLFWLKELEKYFTSHEIKFEIYNHISKKFESKLGELNNQKFLIWFDGLERSKDISEKLNVYTTRDAGRDRKKELHQGPLIYWYIYKNDNFSVKEFAECIKDIATEFERKYQ